MPVRQWSKPLLSMSVILLLATTTLADVGAKDKREHADAAARIEKTLHDGSVWAVAGRDSGTLVGFFPNSAFTPWSRFSNLESYPAYRDALNQMRGRFGILCIIDSGENLSCLRLRDTGAEKLQLRNMTDEQRSDIVDAANVAKRRVSSNAKTLVGNNTLTSPVVGSAAARQQFADKLKSTYPGAEIEAYPSSDEFKILRIETNSFSLPQDMKAVLESKWLTRAYDLGFHHVVVASSDLDGGFIACGAWLVGKGVSRPLECHNLQGNRVYTWSATYRVYVKH